MGPIPLHRHFENHRGEDPGDEVADYCKDFGSIFITHKSRPLFFMPLSPSVSK